MSDKNQELENQIKNMTNEEIEAMIGNLQLELARKIKGVKGVTLDRLGNSRVELDETIIIENKIKRLKEYLAKRIYDDIYTKTRNIGYSEDISWGIRATEPQEIFTEKTGRPHWVKVGGKEPVQIGETMTVSRCGKFRWFDKEGLDIDAIEAYSKIHPFSIPCEEGKNGIRYLKAKDISTGIATAESQKGELDIIRISVKGDIPLEYFMLCSLPSQEVMATEEFRKYFVGICTTTAHERMVAKSFEEDRSIYGGKFHSVDGRGTRTVEDKSAVATAKADYTLGTYMLPNGNKKFATLPGALTKIMMEQDRSKFIQSQKGPVARGII